LSAHTTSAGVNRDDVQTERATDVSIAIVSHGHYRFLEACLSSVFEQTERATVDVTLVDNLAESDVAELVNDRFPNVRLVCNDEPKGFAENNNRVFDAVKSRYCFLLNPDTVVRPGAIDALMDYMDEHDDLGACAPKLLNADGSLQLSCRRFPSISSVLFRRTPLRALFGNGTTARAYKMVDWDHNACRPIDWMFGAAIFARRETWECVGGLDTDMFLFCEDIDWCLRCHRSGWGIDYVSHAEIVHDFDEDKYNKYFTKGRMKHYKTMLQFFLKYPGFCLRWK
jgi:GT2 family glycosyltransferase